MVRFTNPVVASDEKGQQVEDVRIHQNNRNVMAVRGEEGSESRSVVDQPRTAGTGLAYPQDRARRRESIFANLMQAVSHALYDMGGEYRGNR